MSGTSMNQTMNQTMHRIEDPDVWIEVLASDPKALWRKLWRATFPLQG